MEWQKLTKETLFAILVLLSTLPSITLGQGQFSLCEPVNPCQNGGRCFLASETDFFCFCGNTDHYGRLCELPLSDLQCPDDEVIVDCPLDPCITDTCLLYPDAVCGHNVCGECKSEFMIDGVVVDCDADCPEDLPPVICDVNPCDIATCPARTDATCRPNFCGSCDAVFYDSNDNPVNCSCPAGEFIESCPRNQCDGAFCPFAPDAECRSSSCGGCRVAFFSDDQEVFDCQDAVCPEGVTQFDCPLDPCQVTSCPMYPNATCQVNSCGMCASFYVDEGGQGVNCNLEFNCQVQGVTYITGDDFVNECRQCFCLMGLVFCRSELIEGCEVAATQEPTTPAADPCDLQPCLNGGTCRSGIQSLFACLCPTGFVGITCETRIDPCQSSPCRNGGTCTNDGNSFNCECPVQFLGTTCGTANLCVPSPCLNGGECRLREDELTEILFPYCVCPEGYAGFTCNELTDPCVSNPCFNGGQCENQGGGFSCLCGTAFTGDLCEFPFDACEGVHICLNGGTCQSIAGIASCSCPPGYSGAFCEVTPCNSEPCQNGGFCLDINVGEMPYLCICVMGFTGSNCQTPRSVCDNMPCRNGGVCEEVRSGQVRSFTCRCPDGFTGPTCEETVNPCDNNGCCQNGLCIPVTSTLPICFCNIGYMGPCCDTVIDACLSLTCENGGSCISEDDATSCSCREGYSGNNCEIADSVCLSDPCFNDGTCILDSLDPRGYVCDCLDNFEGDRCQSFIITPCFPDPCENGVCVISNVDTTEALCLCETGYTGRFCDQRFDPCQSNPCQNDGICLTSGLNFFCNCTESYMGDTCAEIVLCNPNPCFNGGSCHVVEGGTFECLCPSGFMGTRCNSLPDPCFNNPCVNGDCVPYQRGFSCVCHEGYSGITCEEREDCMCPEDIYVPPSRNQSYYQVEWELPGCTDYTVSSDFQSGGFYPRGRTIVSVRISEGSLVVSTCTFSIFIIDDTLTDPCDPNPCQSGGTCNELQGNNYQCMCPITHTGRNCTVPVFQNPCDSSPCLNDGFCIEAPGTTLGYLCACLLDYIGARCEIPNDGCATAPCQNGATCTPEIGGGYSCECASGYSGRNCTEPLSCASEPCQNSGFCFDLGSFGYICSCQPGYTGPDCNLLDRCSSSPCQNGATCVNGEAGFICTCPEGYSGSLCQVDDEECTLECPDDVTLVVDAGVTVVVASWEYQESVCGFPVMFTHLPGSTFPLGVTAVRGAVRGLDLSRDCSFTVTVELFLSPHCVEEPCENGGTCLGNDLGYDCMCTDGYIGRNCSEREPRDPCEDNPCQNLGTCIAIEDEYICLCREGFLGFNCNQPTIVDVTPPRIDFCPSSITEVALEQDGGAFIFWDEPQATDDSGTTVIAFQDHRSGDFFLFGPTSVTYRIEDPSGNGVDCDFLVTVNARFSPPDCTPGCPANITVVTESTEGFARVFWNQMSMACNYTISSSHRSGSFFLVGVETVSLEFLDGRELVSSCSFDVTVVRGFQPFCTRNLCQNLGTCQELADSFQCICPRGFAGTICEILTSVDEVSPIVTSCPSDVMARTQNGDTTAPATWRMPQAIDDSGTVSLFYQSHFPGDQFEVGVTTVMYKFCDPHGNKAMCQFRVIVENIEECEIRCPPNITKFADTGVEFISVTWEQPDTMCNLALVSTRAPGSFFGSGPSAVTLMLLNNSQAVVQRCQFWVFIHDADLGNPCDDPDVCGTGDCFLDPTNARGFRCECTRCFSGDYCETALPVVNPCNSGMNLCQNGGSCSFTDCNFLCTCPEDFTGVYCDIRRLVLDITPPVLIGCPMDITRTVNERDNEAVVTWDEVRYIDSSGTAYFAGSSHESGDTFPLGLTPVTMIYSDASRNFAYCRFNVIVQQVGVTCETNVCPEDVQQFSTGIQEYMQVFWDQPPVVCGLSVESFPQTGALFPIGESQVTWTMFNANGIPKAGCVFQVIVKDDFTNPCADDPCDASTICLSNPNSPVGYECLCVPGDENCVDFAFEGDNSETVTGCTSRMFTIEKGNTTLNLTWEEPVISGLHNRSVSHKRPYLFPIGDTLVTYNITFLSGNTTTCSFNVTIVEVDTRPPTIFDCPANPIEPEVSEGIQHVFVEYTRPNATDLSGIRSVEVDPSHQAMGGFFTMGKNHSIVWTFEDNAGNCDYCVIRINLGGN